MFVESLFNSVVLLEIIPVKNTLVLVWSSLNASSLNRQQTIGHYLVQISRYILTYNDRELIWDKRLIVGMNPGRK